MSGGAGEVEVGARNSARGGDKGQGTAPVRHAYLAWRTLEAELNDAGERTRALDVIARAVGEGGLAADHYRAVEEAERHARLRHQGLLVGAELWEAREAFWHLADARGESAKILEAVLSHGVHGRGWAAVAGG